MGSDIPAGEITPEALRIASQIGADAITEASEQHQAEMAQKAKEEAFSIDAPALGHYTKAQIAKMFDSMATDFLPKAGCAHRNHRRKIGR